MERQTHARECDLFDAHPAFLPLLTEGETLFSWAARYHRLSGNALAKQTSIQLYGSGRAGLRHDFPSHLDQFVRLTRGLLGDAESLAYERTIFGFFAPFQDEQGASNVLTQMRGSSVEKVKSTLGLLPSRLGAFFSLKACPDCIKDDLKEYSVSKWHLEHQWPSVWVCRRHRKMLQLLKRESQPNDLRQWLLPEDVAEEEWDRLAISSADTKSKLLWIAELSAHIAQLKGMHLSHQLLRYTYLLRVKERGWLYTDGSLKLALVRQSFLKYYLKMVKVPSFEIVRGVQAQHAGILGLLMRQYDWRRHPVKHLLLMAFLFDDVAELDGTYNRVCRAHEEGGVDALETMVCGEWKSELKRLVEVERKSVSSAAAAIGIPMCVAIREAKGKGIAYQKRPRVFNSEFGDVIRKMIATGLTRAEILRETGIKKTLLKDFMAREPELRDAWQRKDLERRRDNYRSNFLDLIDRYRGVPVKKLRTVPGNGVSWLHRNDREWLIENLPSMSC